jgi:hypothetical protein
MFHPHAYNVSALHIKGKPKARDDPALTFPSFQGSTTRNMLIYILKITVTLWFIVIYQGSYAAYFNSVYHNASVYRNVTTTRPVS